MGQKKIFSKKKNLTFKKALLIWMVSLIVLGGMIFLLGKFVLSDSNGSSNRLVFLHPAKSAMTSLPMRKTPINFRVSQTE